MEVTQFTYFQQVGGIDCEAVSAEMTYGLERLAMYVQGVDHVYDLSFNGRSDARKLLWRCVPAGRAGIQRATTSSTPTRRCCSATSRTPRANARRCSPAPRPRTPPMALPAYDQCIKASHLFNLLDARGVISVTERQSYIVRVRALAKACCAAWLKTKAAGSSAPSCATTLPATAP